MRLKSIAFITGGFVLLLGIFGLITGEGRLFEQMNIDLVLDVTRISLGAFLIYGGLKSEELSKTALFTFGAMYIVMFIGGLLDPSIMGIIPGGLGLIDQVLHLGGGIAGIILPSLYNQRGRVAF